MRDQRANRLAGFGLPRPDAAAAIFWSTTGSCERERATWKSNDACSKGERTLAEVVEEVSQSYARRYEIDRDSAWFLLKLQEEVGELTQAFLIRSGQARSKGCSAQEIEERFRSELADVLCHVLLLARHHGVDVEEAVRRPTRHVAFDSPVSNVIALAQRPHDQLV
jgi:NTP pyrophosphatase (non-canonical NTP hydrolase)